MDLFRRIREFPGKENKKKKKKKDWEYLKKRIMNGNVQMAT